MNILVFNCGSSSLKYRIISMPAETERAGGEAQRVGPKTAEPSRIVHRSGGKENTVFVDMTDHAAAFSEVMKLLEGDPRLKPDAFGHRVVHGATLFDDAVILDDASLGSLHSIEYLAPLHNPPATRLIETCRDRRPDLPQVAVFDTAYHATIPDYASTYAMPPSLCSDTGIRKYGFHGTSHRYVVGEAAAYLDMPLSEINGVSCHLGSGGASLAAISAGRSVDNTFGFSPLQGLVMSTRCGDLDPAVSLRLIAGASGDTDVVETLLNKKSGVLGLSGDSADIRDVLAGAGEADGNRFQTTAGLYQWRIRKYLGAYLSVVPDPRVIIFTDTIGETVPAIRAGVCAGMECFGVRIDPEKNENISRYPVDIAAVDSDIRVLVILTNEELAIARSTFAVLAKAA